MERNKIRLSENPLSGWFLSWINFSPFASKVTVSGLGCRSVGRSVLQRVPVPGQDVFSRNYFVVVFLFFIGTIAIQPTDRSGGEQFREELISPIGRIFIFPVLCRASMDNLPRRLNWILERIVNRCGVWSFVAERVNRAFRGKWISRRISLNGWNFWVVGIESYSGGRITGTKINHFEIKDLKFFLMKRRTE